MGRYWLVLGTWYWVIRGCHPQGGTEWYMMGLVQYGAESRNLEKEN